MVPDMQDQGPEAWRAFAIGAGGMLPVAGLARLLYHYRLVRVGRRKFWSRELLWEIPTALLSAIMGIGVASAALGFLPDSVGADPVRAFNVTHCIVGFCAWLGPRGIEVALSQLVRRHAGEPKEN